MAPYYKIVTSHSALPLDQTLLDTMEQQNKDELQKIEDRLAEAEKQEGETEISDALRAKATYLTRIGDKVCPCFITTDLERRTDVCGVVDFQDRAIEAQKLALEKTPGLGARIDIVLTLVRIGFFFADHEMITSNLTKADEYVIST